MQGVIKMQSHQDPALAGTQLLHFTASHQPHCGNGISKAVVLTPTLPDHYEIRFVV